ncbi:potassium voltage-gated channel protein Shaw-like [Montipora capricornis]|uniref:potassium voltage-gated channel protein Shaw-like n=1 Tax=Montipora capricornis TaxID=246305 RepID=UPI0035F1221F
MSRSRSRLFDSDNPGETRLYLNVGGQKHETFVSTLTSIPDTRLAWIAERAMKDPRPLGQKREFFFDRNPAVFTHILNFYRTGKLHCPRDVCGPLFEEELNFWGLDEKQIETCCWAKYDEHRDAEEKLQGFSRDEDQESEVEDIESGSVDLELPSSGSELCYETRKITALRSRHPWQGFKKKIWKTFDDPYSSKFARLVGYISLIFNVAVVTQFCILTLDYFADRNSTQHKVLFITETIAVSWFTLDIVIRFLCCPDRAQFLKTVQNWLDFIAIIPYYLLILTPYDEIVRNFGILYVFRMARTFRPLKFSYVMQVFTQTLRASSRELYFLIFILALEVVVYGTLVYYSERNVSGTRFTSIPESFWWALVTMTTVGYGDMYPATLPGKLVGCICAISGVLMIALPVSVVASNFSLYNSYAKVKLKLPSRGKKTMVDNALKALQLSTPQTSVSVASPDGVNGRGRYSSLVSSGIEMGLLNCSKKNSCEETEGMVNHEAEQHRRYAPRRSTHFSLNLVPIRAHPELPEGDSDPEDGRKECDENHPQINDKHIN